jgi:hypothetical protein
MTKKTIFLMLLIIIISGCTICEKPYIKVDGDCCLDDNSNSICDDKEEIEIQKINEKTEVKTDNDAKIEEETTKIEKKEEVKNDDGDMFILDYKIDKINLVSDYFESTIPEDAKFIITTNKIDKIMGVTLSFIPMCKEKGEINIFLNEQLIESITPNCKKTNEVKIDNQKIIEGINQFQFSTSNNDYSIENGTISLEFDGLDNQKQQIDSFYLENNKEQAKLNSNSKVVIRNYNDMKFKLNQNEIVGDINLDLNIVEEGHLFIYLNNYEIYNDRSTGNIELNLPRDKLIIGSNTLRYLVVP